MHLQIVADTIPCPQNKRENCLISKIRINSCQSSGLAALYYCCGWNWFWATYIIIYNQFCNPPCVFMTTLNKVNKTRKRKRGWIFCVLMMCVVDVLYASILLEIPGTFMGQSQWFSYKYSWELQLADKYSSISLPPWWEWKISLFPSVTVWKW